MAFHEVRFPDGIGYGVTGGPEFSTTIVATAAGYEYRNQNWATARGRWDVGTGLKTQAQVDELVAFFRARCGRSHGFPFKDWSDYRGFQQTIGLGDGATKSFQLVKAYVSGAVMTVRRLTKPVAGTVSVYLGAVRQTVGWGLDYTTGLVTFTEAPARGVVVVADFEFDVPVRFDTDRMGLRIESVAHQQWAGIPIVELRG